jgi:hypothetical protein
MATARIRGGLACHKFSNVSALEYLLCKTHYEQDFENTAPCPPHSRARALSLSHTGLLRIEACRRLLSPQHTMCPEFGVVCVTLSVGGAFESRRMPVKFNVSNRDHVRTRPESILYYSYLIHVYLWSEAGHGA